MLYVIVELRMFTFETKLKGMEMKGKNYSLGTFHMISFVLWIFISVS